MKTYTETHGDYIYGNFVAQSHSISQGGRSTPIDYEEMTIEALYDSTTPGSPQWLALQLGGFSGDLRTQYKTSFSLPLDVLERVLQVFLEGEHGNADQGAISQMIWRLAQHRSNLIEAPDCADMEPKR
jgi:hypothetical protein